MTATVSTVIMAHPKRERWVPYLLGQLDGPAEVIWDQVNDRHETGLRCLRHPTGGASHRLIVQDDVKVCRDLIAGMAKAAEHSGEHPVSGFVRRRPAERRLTPLLDAAVAVGAPWVEAPGPWWGQALMLPSHHLDALADWFAASTVENYDRRIARWYQHRGVTCLYTVPSLVEHRDGTENPSLVPGRASRGRVAHQWIGAQGSALDIDWSGRVMTRQRQASREVLIATRRQGTRRSSSDPYRRR